MEIIPRTANKSAGVRSSHFVTSSFLFRPGNRTFLAISIRVEQIPTHPHMRFIRIEKSAKFTDSPLWNNHGIIDNIFETGKWEPFSTAIDFSFLNFSKCFNSPAILSIVSCFTCLLPHIRQIVMKGGSCQD